MTTAPRTWRIPTLPLGDWIFITLCGWGMALVLVPAALYAIDHIDVIAGVFGWDAGPVDITESGWVIVAGIVPWYIGIVCGYYVHEYLPAFVAQGRTRRDSAIEAGVFGVALAGLIALLLTVGFVLERGLYALMGWSRGTPDDMLFTSYDHLATIFWTTLLTAIVWAAAGMAVGAAYYRDSGRGIVMALLAVILVLGSGIATGPTGPFYGLTERLSLPDNVPIVTLTSLVATGILLALCWATVRGTPIRNK